MEAWNQRIRAFKKLYIVNPLAIENQKTYMQSVYKTRKYTVSQFWDQIQWSNLLIPLFPDTVEDDKFTDKELKKIVFNAMPNQWCSNFRNAGQDLHQATSSQIYHYMVQQELMANAYIKQKEKNKNNNENKNGQSKNGNKNNKWTNNKKQNKNKNAENNEEKSGKIQPNDPCPLHGGKHPWNKCFQNQYRKNFRPKKQQNNYYNQGAEYNGRTNYSNNFSAWSYNGSHPPPATSYYNADSRDGDSMSFQSRNNNSDWNSSNSYDGRM